MTNPEIKQIGDYIKDLEEGLYEFDYDRISMQTEYAKVYKIIETLQKLTFETKDQDLKPVLATLELRAHKCLENIQIRLAIRN